MRFITAATVITTAALGLRLLLAIARPNDAPDDGRLYAQIARNVLEHHGYSSDDGEPYEPTYIRVPGYPLFLAAVYRAWGYGNDEAVRAIQAVADTVTCLLVAGLATLWAPATWNREKKRKAFLIALALAAIAPFTLVYVCTMLTETLATMLIVACVLTGTLGIRAAGRTTRAAWLAASGLLGGAATMMRPDGAFFVAATGATMVLVDLVGERRWRQAAFDSLMLTIAFAATLAPWTIRNARLFAVFQPIAPHRASMPDEFVPLGYLRWLRTWVDDERYLPDFKWALDLGPISVAKAPARAFDTPDERARVAALLDRINNRPDDEQQMEMTPEIDSGFARIASERIARHPIRYYLVLPVRRAISLWFDTHSRYYPFAGTLFPLSALRSDQKVWLPLFSLLTWVYTLLGVAGAAVSWRSAESRKWVLLLALLILPRLAFLSSMESPEPRYAVEFFPFMAASAGIAAAALRR